MNTELLKIDDWMKANKLSLNYKKKKNRILVVNKLKSQSSRLNIKIGNNTITQVKQTKYLGVLLNEDLTWALKFDINAQKLQGEIGPWLA